MDPALSVLENVKGLLTSNDDGKTGRDTESFLRRSDHDVDSPVVKAVCQPSKQEPKQINIQLLGCPSFYNLPCSSEGKGAAGGDEPNLLARNRADAIKNNDRLRADLLYAFCDHLRVREDASRGVDVGESEDLVLLLAEGFLDLLASWGAADGGGEGGDGASVGGEAVGEGVAKVATTHKAAQKGEREGEERVSFGRRKGKGGGGTNELRTRQLSPSSTRFAPTASHPRVPLPAMRKGWASFVMSTSRVIRMQSPKTYIP
jgi:hypothetical protein